MKTSHQHRVITAIIFIALTSCTISCNHSIDVQPSDKITNDSIEFYLNFLRSSGFNKEGIVYDKGRQIFIIGEDMHTSLADVKTRYRLKTLQRGARPSQWRWTYLVNQSVVKHIKIYVSNDIPSNWVGGINDAIEYWNAIPETQVQFKLTSNSSEAQIQISNYQDVTGTIAAAQLPQSNGQPGSYLKINTDGNKYYSGNSLFLRNAITHELGHTIGLMHTDYRYNVSSDPNYDPNAQFITGTSQPNDDPYSIMHHAVDDQLEFTSSDLIAIRILYPFTWSALLDKPRGYPDEVGMINVTWDSSVDNSTVKIELYDDDNNFVSQLASAAPNTGSFSVSNPSINVGFYQIKLTFNSNATHTDLSDDLFYYRNN